MQCVYFWGESIHQSEAQGGEAYGIFRGQLEEGDAGIRKLAILLLVDWEYFPCVGWECDWGAPGAYEHIKTPIGPWDRWTVSHHTTAAASHLFNLQNDLYKDLFHDKSLFRDAVYRCGADTAAFEWEPRLTLHPHECDAGCFGLDQALSLLIGSPWTELRHTTVHVSLCGTVCRTFSQVSATFLCTHTLEKEC